MTGFRTWSTGDTVSAADFSSYIATQCLTVFSTATARDAAITSPAEGMFSYTITTPEETLSYYDGSSWVATSLTADITGITTAAASGLSGGATSGNVTLTLNLAGVTAAQAFGSDGAGVDVTLHSGTAGDYAMWDASEEKLILEGTNGATVLDVTDGNVVIGDGTLVVGSDGAGEEVTFHSGTAGDYLQWDSSEEKLILEGTNGATVLDVTDGNVVVGDGTLSVSGGITATGGVSGNVTGSSGPCTGNAATATSAGVVTTAAQGNITSVGALTGLTIGSDGSGGDVTFYSDTAGDSLVWDSSAESLTITGTNAQTALAVADGNVTITDDLTVSGSTFTYLNVLTDSTTTRTPALTDAGAYILTTHGTGITVTLPQNSAVAFPIGTTIYFERNGAGTLTFAAGTGASVTSKDSTLTCGDRYTTVAAIKIGTNAWSLIGNIG